MYSVCYSDRHAGKPGTICSAAMSREYLEAENLKPGKMMAKAWQSTQAYRVGNEMIMRRLYRKDSSNEPGLEERNDDRRQRGTGNMRVDVCEEAAIGSYKAGMASDGAAIQDGWAVRGS